jgi:hypothetical protein
MTPPAVAKHGGRGVQAVSWVLNGLGLLIGVWAVFEYGPFPWSAVVCPAAAVAAIAIAMAFPDAFGLFGDKRPGARSLAMMLLAPLIGLIVIAAFGVKLLHLSSDLVPAIVGAVAGALLAGLWWLRFHNNWRAWWLMSALGLLVGCAEFEELDARADHTPPQLFKVPVTAQWVSHGRRNTSYYIDLPPWGPQHEPDSVRVSTDVYDNVAPGDLVCLKLYPGALGARWYTVDVCPPSAR